MILIVKVHFSRLPRCVLAGCLIDMIMCSSVLFIQWYAILIAPQISGNKPSSDGKTLGLVNSQHSHKSKTNTNLLIQTSQSKICHKIQTFLWYSIHQKKRELSRGYRLNYKVCFNTLNNQTYIPSAIAKHCMIKITKITSSSSFYLHN